MRVAVVGGGLAGMAAAWELALLGHSVTLIEATDQLGGQARSFSMEGARYPVAYHHILASDAPLHRYLKRLGLAGRTRWRRAGVAFRIDGRSYDLSRPADLWRFPMTLRSKLSLARVNLAASFRTQHEDVSQLDAQTWLQRQTSSNEVTRLFEAILGLRFQTNLEGVSASYLQQRMQAGEGSRALGYFPGEFWTEALIDRLEAELVDAGVSIRLNTPVSGFALTDGQISGVSIETTERPAVDGVVAAVTPAVLRRLLPHSRAPWIQEVSTVGVVSCVMETDPVATPDHYWTTCLSPRLPFAAVFRWEALNPELGMPGRSLFNFSRYAPTRELRTIGPEFEEASTEQFLAAFEENFGVRLRSRWSHLTVIPRYTPVYAPGFCVAPTASGEHSNLFFAGSFRTFPAVATTGVALASGEEAALALHQLSQARQ